MNSNYHHGEDIDIHKDLILRDPNIFFKDLIETLERLEYMGPFYNWPKKKQKESEVVYYKYEKKMLSYLVFGTDFKHQEKIVSSFIIIYASLVYKFINWYNNSEYKGLNYNVEELETMIKSHLIDSIYKYIGNYQNVRIPFGSFLKKRIFIQFRGELQDHLRKIVLYEKWKPFLYENSRQNNDISLMHEFSSIEYRMKLLKEYFLYEDASQNLSKEDEHFLHNYFFIYYFVEKKSLTKFTENTKFNPTKFIEAIKEELEIFKSKLKDKEVHAFG